MTTRDERRFLITGGAGFIGSHLTDRLLADGHAVTVLDDLSTGRRENLALASDRPGFTLHRGDVRDAALVGRLVDGADAVVHLAAAVGVKRILDRPVESLETNLLGTDVVLRCAAERGRALLLASSSEVYGKSARLPFREDDDLVLGSTGRARWSYACAKAACEWLALAFAREAGLPVVVCRFFNTVGPRQTGRYGMVLPTFARQALRGEPITVYGSGAQSRSFGHVDDTVEAVVRLLREPGSTGRVFNVGSDREVTIDALAALVRDAAGSDSPIVHIPYAEAYAAGFEDMPRRVPDCSRLAEVTGFRPAIALEAIVADVIAAERERFAAAAR
jgi:UDP-glucose 4-epimerase